MDPLVISQIKATSDGMYEVTAKEVNSEKKKLRNHVSLVTDPSQYRVGMRVTMKMVPESEV
jgi:hypothetical protein